MILDITSLIQFHVGCLTFGAFGTLSGVTEIWTITCIVYERRRKICNPLDKYGRLSNYQINMMIISIWGIGIFVSILPLLSINRYVLEVIKDMLLLSKYSFLIHVFHAQWWSIEMGQQ